MRAITAKQNRILKPWAWRFLEKLTPLAARLHHKLDFPADQPLFEMVIIGFGPHDYGPEVWTVEYRMTQTVGCDARRLLADARTATALRANLSAG